MILTITLHHQLKNLDDLKLRHYLKHLHCIYMINIAYMGVFKDIYRFTIKILHQAVPNVLIRVHEKKDNNIFVFAAKKKWGKNGEKFIKI